MSDHLNNNPLSFPNSDTSTHQFPDNDDAENYQFNHEELEKISVYDYGYAVDDPIPINSNFNINGYYPVNDNPMSSLPTYHQHDNSGTGSVNNIATSFSSGRQLLSTNTSPIDHNLPPIPQNAELPSQSFGFDSGEKDDYSLSYMLESAREVGSSMAANKSVATSDSRTVSTTLPETIITAPTTIRRELTASEPQVVLEASDVDYNRIYANLSKVTQNHRNLMAFQCIQGLGSYSRNRQVLDNNNNRNNGYSFTVLNSQDPRLPVTLPGFNCGTSGMSRSVGQMEGGRQASSIRHYQLQPQRMSDYSRLSTGSNFESGNNHNQMRWGERPSLLISRSSDSGSGSGSFEADGYQVWKIPRSKRGRISRSGVVAETTPRQLNPFAYETQFSVQQRRVPVEIGLQNKLENPLQQNPTHHLHLTASSNIDLKTHASWRNNTNGDEENNIPGRNLAMPLKDNNGVETIITTGNGANTSTHKNGDSSKFMNVVGKGKEVVHDDAQGNGVVLVDAVQNMMNVEGEEDPLNFIDVESEEMLMTTDRFGFDE